MQLIVWPKKLKLLFYIPHKSSYMFSLLMWNCITLHNLELLLCHADINECIEDPCGSIALCANTAGSYSCICDSGYTWTGTTCAGNNIFNTYTVISCAMIISFIWAYQLFMLSKLDVNECESGINDDCAEFAACINTPGSHECMCLSGYVGDGITCTGSYNIDQNRECF